MKSQLKWSIGLAAVLCSIFLTTALAAQSQAPQFVTFQRGGAVDQQGGAIVPAGRGGGVAFSNFELPTNNQPVTSAPYSAQVTTETVQLFADGNSISHKSVSTVYRDSQGRTRREQSMPVVGMGQVSAAGGQVQLNDAQFISIDDPVSGSRYTLNPMKKTAAQIPYPTKKYFSGPAPTGDVMYAKKGAVDGSGNLSVTYAPGPVLEMKISPVQVEPPVTESLGAQTMEGLSVIGTRTIRTIPAGQIGNAQPIQIITEQWYSPDLQIMVMTKHSDPRTGTTTTTLSNLSRNEPNASLFVVPPGYTMQPINSLKSTLPMVVKEPQ